MRKYLFFSQISISSKSFQYFFFKRMLENKFFFKMYGIIMALGRLNENENDIPLVNPSCSHLQCESIKIYFFFYEEKPL